MTGRDNFRGFFSYSHIDAQVDPDAIASFSADLESRVNSRLVNASFDIWIDQDRLKTGFKWDDRIIEGLRNSDLLIVILTPKWIDSDYCRKELDIFLDVENKYEVGEYIAPILARSMEKQEKHLNREQKRSYEKLIGRQYSKILTRDFLKLSSAERATLIENVADDIEGMIERIRDLRKDSEPVKEKLLPSRGLPTEFDSRAHNFEHVDFLSEAEVVVEKPDGDKSRAIFAHIGFIPRMYVQSKTIRVEFGIQRAFLSLSAVTEEDFLKSDEVRERQLHKNAYYVVWRHSPASLTLCIDPLPGSNTLQELPLIPAQNENRFAKIADASANLDYTKVNAVLSVSLSAEGLFIFGEEDRKPSSSQVNKIAAIANIALAKDEKLRFGHIEKIVPVNEKNR